ncbi:MAG: hypothetical protein IAF58_13405 [Leptolyngbya sp.]|nr:hypothetical protein [Candidatus Melainabacteria bacterium]
MDSSEAFNLQETIKAIQQAFSAVVVHVFFDAGLHGLCLAMVVGVIGYVLRSKGKKQGKPLINVCRKLAVFCLAIMVPGFVSLLMTHSLPPVGVYNVNSLGFICFWNLVVLFICAEEMNHQFFPGGDSHKDSDLASSEAHS